MSFDLESLYKSLIRRVQDTVDRIRLEGISSDMEYYAWDSRAEEKDIPHKDLLGLAGWAFHENGGLWTVRSGLTLSTYNDKNLFREIRALDIIHEYWGEQQTVPMLDKLTGKEVTRMVVMDFDMMPAGNSEQRNYRPIGIELLKTES